MLQIYCRYIMKILLTQPTKTCQAIFQTVIFPTVRGERQFSGVSFQNEREDTHLLARCVAASATPVVFLLRADGLRTTAPPGITEDCISNAPGLSRPTVSAAPHPSCGWVPGERVPRTEAAAVWRSTRGKREPASTRRQASKGRPGQPRRARRAPLLTQASIGRAGRRPHFGLTACRRRDAFSAGLPSMVSRSGAGRRARRRADRTQLTPTHPTPNRAVCGQSPR